MKLSQNSRSLEVQTSSPAGFNSIQHLPQVMGPLLASGWPLCPVLHETIPPNLQNKDFPKATHPFCKHTPSCFKGLDIFSWGIQPESSSNAASAVYLADQIKKSNTNRAQTPSFPGKYFRWSKTDSSWVTQHHLQAVGMKSSKLFSCQIQHREALLTQISDLKAEPLEEKNPFGPKFWISLLNDHWKHGPKTTSGTAGNLRPFPSVPAFWLFPKICGKWESRGCSRKQTGISTAPLDGAGANGKTIPLGWLFPSTFARSITLESSVSTGFAFPYKSFVELSTQSFPALHSSLNISPSQTSSFPIPFYFISISALRPGQPEAAAQGGGKVLVAPRACQ